MTTSVRFVALAIVLLASLVQGAKEFEPINGFTIGPEAAEIMNLGRDMEAIKRLFEHKKGIGTVRQAWDIYEMGGYAETIANLTLDGPLPVDLRKGWKITGQSKNGKTAVGYPKEDYMMDQYPTYVEIIYSPDSQEDNPCHVGGLSNEFKEEGGCFVSPGYLQVGNEDKLVPFNYDLEANNVNARTIQELGLYANRYYRMRSDPNNSFYKFFLKYINYYGLGEASFASKLNVNAHYGGKYEFEKGYFDLNGLAEEKKADFFHLTSAYLIMGFSVVRAMEEAVQFCRDACEICVHESVKAVDAAAAYYTGAQQQEDGSGNLLYGLANDMCKKFKTCGEDGDKTYGTAKVNLDIFSALEELKTQVGKNKCTDAARTKERITNLLLVPLIQGFKFSTFRLDNPAIFPDDPDGSLPFTAAVFPLLDSCEMEEVMHVEIDFGLGNEMQVLQKLNKVEEQMQDYYWCLGVCCHQIGGMWDTESGEYFKDHAPCLDDTDRCAGKADPMDVEEPSDNGAKGWMIGILVAAVIVTCALYYRKRTRYFPSSSSTETKDNNGSVETPNLTYA